MATPLAWNHGRLPGKADKVGSRFGHWNSPFQSCNLLMVSKQSEAATTDFLWGTHPKGLNHAELEAWKSQSFAVLYTEFSEEISRICCLYFRAWQKFEAALGPVPPPLPSRKDMK